MACGERTLQLASPKGALIVPQRDSESGK